jgi:hypothetical protein
MSKVESGLLLKQGPNECIPLYQGNPQLVLSIGLLLNEKTENWLIQPQPCLQWKFCLINLPRAYQPTNQSHWWLYTALHVQSLH